MSKFTPGPWSVQESEYRKVEVAAASKRGLTKVIARPTSTHWHLVAQRANARLIAAAPEMYSLLERYAHTGDAELSMQWEQLQKRIDGETHE